MRQKDEFYAAIERMQATKQTLIKRLTKDIGFKFDIEPRQNGMWWFFEIDSGIGMELEDAFALIEQRRNGKIDFGTFKKLC